MLNTASAPCCDLWSRLIRVALAPLVLAWASAATAQPAAPAVIEVQAGDTFSEIAARHTGDVRNWRKLYRADLSNLLNPNRIAVGMRIELTTDSSGAQYLRALPANSASTTTRAPAAVAAPQLAAAPATPAAPPAAAATSETLVIGVLPNIAAATLNLQYERLQRYLARVDGRRVQIVVPANFKVFFDNMMKGDYDLAVAAPHFARVAQQDRKMIPLVTYEPRINALLVAPSESSVAAPRDVRERAVGFANPQSLVAMYGQQWLKQAGLEPGRDYEVKAARTDLGVGRMLLTGDIVAAILSNGEFRSLPAEESARMKVVEVIARIPNFVIMAHPRIERERLARLKSELKAFLADKDEGEPFAKATGFTAIIDADESMLRELDAFSALTRRAMGVGN